MGLALNTSERWVEYWALILLLIGFMFALKIEYAGIAYASAIVFGIIFGRLIWHDRKLIRPLRLVVTLGFMAGFVFGSPEDNRKLIILLFAAGMLVSFYVHKRKLIGSASY